MTFPFNPDNVLDLPRVANSQNDATTVAVRPFLSTLLSTRETIARQSIPPFVAKERSGLRLKSLRSQRFLPQEHPQGVGSIGNTGPASAGEAPSVQTATSFSVEPMIVALESPA